MPVFAVPRFLAHHHRAGSIKYPSLVSIHVYVYEYVTKNLTEPTKAIQDSLVYSCFWLGFSLVWFGFKEADL